jgi:NAD(P)H dehydrogenase (quinone)
MKTVSIVYFSGGGHTAKMAEAVAVGARSVAGVSANLIALRGEDIVQGRYTNDAVFAQLDGSDAIIFGSPTYMGDVAGQVKCFLDAGGSRWYNRAWVDKLAAGFTVSSGPSGDKLHTLQTFMIFAMQCGMVWVSHNEMPLGPESKNRLSSYSGAMGQAGQEPPETAPNAADRSAGEALGARVAQATLRWSK